MNEREKEAALQAAVAQLNAGGIIAVKGLVVFIWPATRATITQWRCCGRVNIVRRNHWR